LIRQTIPNILLSYYYDYDYNYAVDICKYIIYKNVNVSTHQCESQAIQHHTVSVAIAISAAESTTTTMTLSPHTQHSLALVPTQRPPVSLFGDYLNNTPW